MRKTLDYKESRGSFTERHALMAIVLLYCCLYGLALVTRVSDIAFMAVDERSIMGSIHGLFSGPFYNMNEQYHSKVYGWTYFSINFAVMSPLKFFQVESEVIYNSLARGIIFFIGLALSLVFHAVSKRVFSRALALFLTFIFITNPVSAHFFTIIHPESTGMLFYLLGLLYLFKFFSADSGKLHLYLIGLAWFCFSALSKQPFAITSFFTIVLFPVFLWWSGGRSILSYLRQRQTWGLLAASIIAALAILFVVHPYSILDFSSFLKGQLRPLSHSAGRSLEVAAPLWYDQLKENPLATLNFMVLFTLPFSKKLRLPALFVYSVLISSALALLFMFMQKLFIQVTYLYPLYPLFLWNIAFALQSALKPLFCRGKTSGRVLIVLLVFLFAPLLVLNTLQSAYTSYARFQLEGHTTKSQSYSYINALSSDKKFFYMPSVAIPKDLKPNSCHVWRNCHTIQGIREFSPDYIFVAWGYKYFNPNPLNSYMQEESYELIDEFRGGKSIGDECGEPEYKVKRRLEPQKKDRVDRRKEALRSEYSFYKNASPYSLSLRVGDCLSRFIEVSSMGSTEKFIGLDIEVWKKL